MPQSADLPIVIYLDLDGTIIGDITPQVTEWEILSRFCPKQLKQFKEYLKADLLMGIMRSNLSKALIAIKNMYPTAEFFIYTASEGSWANTIIPCVEAATNVTFNRPILSRKNCIQTSFEKSLRLVAPIVHRRLKSKYPALTSVDQLYQNSFLVDNTDVLIDGEQQRCLQCPTFEGIYWPDMLRHIPIDEQKRHYVEISIMMRGVGLYPKVNSKEHFSFEEFRMTYYSALADKIKQTYRDRKNKDRKSDNLWLALAKVLINARLDKGFTDSTCKYMKKKLAGALHMKDT